MCEESVSFYVFKYIYHFFFGLLRKSLCVKMIRTSCTFSSSFFFFNDLFFKVYIFDSFGIDFDVE